MIKLQGKLDREVYVACSGGVDSMTVAHFLSNNHRVNLVFFNHGTNTSNKAANFVAQHADAWGFGLIYGHGERNKPDHKSWEEHWRDERYKFFHTIHADVITAHHLDDCVETWVWSSMHGTGKIIPYRNKNVIRPFRLNRKRDLRLWSELNNVPHIEDDTNTDLRYTRNYIRHEMMPHVLRVNPGIHKTIMKKVRNEYST
jgi:tRNA(Ile)-lysidine synthase